VRSGLRILIVGASGSSHLGSSLLRAAHRLRVEAKLCDTKSAWRHGTLRQKLFWHFAGRRPIALERFSRAILETCVQFRPDIIVTTGSAPVSARTLRSCRQKGVKCLNFSTDDPFNPRQRAPWLLRALREYDVVFTPRTANQEELRLHGCRQIAYLPFGYDDALFLAEANVDRKEESDLFFAGTGTGERAPYIRAAVEAGFRVRLHGIYWDRFAGTRGVSRGQADIPTLREAIASCKVALCLVRHENRDGHSMRSFEVPAVGACMVVEDTEEHRQIFGEDGTRVLYFKSAREMVERTRTLLANEILRRSLRDNVHLHITNGANTYADRLASMINAL
jgi:spore maturation protein CgeB